MDEEYHIGIPPPSGEEWTAKRRLSLALRNFIEVVLTSTPKADALNQIAEKLEETTHLFAKTPRVYGRSEWATKGDFPSFAHVFHEINILTGASNPFGPAIETWMEEGIFYGRVNIGWAYEGPPNCVHGGILAGIFDHFLGAAQYPLAEQMGMTRYLNVSYLSPTPLNKDLKLITKLVKKEGRKVFLSGEMFDGNTLTATCDALFIDTMRENEKQ